MSKRVIYKNIVNELLEKYDVSPNWSTNGESAPNDPNMHWWSMPDEKEVLIPKPTDIYKFMVCLHEIGHCVKGLRKLFHVEEYVAECWAIATAKKYGIESTMYEKKAASDLIKAIKSDIAAGKIHLHKINPEIKSWIKKRGIKYEIKKLRKLRSDNSNRKVESAS
jgi:hypothetical protein